MYVIVLLRQKRHLFSAYWHIGLLCTHKMTCIEILHNIKDWSQAARIGNRENRRNRTGVEGSMFPFPGRTGCPQVWHQSLRTVLASHDTCLSGIREYHDPCWLMNIDDFYRPGGKNMMLRGLPGVSCCDASSSRVQPFLWGHDFHQLSLLAPALGGKQRHSLLKNPQDVVKAPLSVSLWVWLTIILWLQYTSSVDLESVSVSLYVKNMDRVSCHACM